MPQTSHVELTPRRPRPSDDVSVSGRLVAPLYGACGVALILFGLTTDVPRHEWVAAGGVAAAVIAGIGARLDWSRVPRWMARSMPYLGLVLLFAEGWACPPALSVTSIAIAMALMWGGVALDLVDLIGLSLGTIPTVGVAALLTDGATLGSAASRAAQITLVVTVIGAAMHWLRRQLDAAQERAVQAQAGAAEAALVQQQEREQAERERAAAAAAELAQRVSLQEQVSSEATALASAATAVSGQADAAADAVAEMSTALGSLSQTAQVSDRIAADVAEQAHEASEVMTALAESSRRILAASDVIQAVAEQTNLLALNATIEAARAGEAGKGFAVVAEEVKDLARQSAANADDITRTLAEVQEHVEAAVARVAGISASMEEVGAQNQTVAAAVEEQSATITTVADSVTESAAQARHIAERARTLEQISRVG